MKKSSLRWQMLGLFLVGIVLVWSAAFFELQRNRERAMADARIASQFQAKLFAENSRSLFKRLDEVLFDLRVHWSDEEQQFTKQVQKQLDHITDLAFQIGVIDKNGFLAYTNLKKSQERVDLSDREHFKVHKDSGEDKLFISKPLKGKVSGRWTIQFTRPIFDAKGGFIGVIVLSLSPDSLVDFRKQLNFQPGSVVTVINQDGVILGRYPDSDDTLGKTIASAPHQLPDAPPSGSFLSPGRVDALERVYGYSKLTDFGITFAFGQSVEEVLNEQAEQQVFIVKTGGLVSLFIGLMVLMLYRLLAARMQARLELLDSEERFKRLTKLTTVAIAIHDGEKLLDVNPSFCELFGYDVSELVGKKFTPLFSESSRIIIKDKVSKAEEEPYEVVGLRKDGTTFPAEVKGKNVLYEGQSVRVASILDTSERKRAEEELRASEERYHNLFTGSKIAKLLIDPQSGQILDANIAATEFYGYDLDRLKAMNISEINILSKEEIADEMALAKAERRSHFHFRHRLASGEIRDVEVHSGPVRLKGRTILYSLVHDETVRRRLENEHRKLIRAIEHSPVSILITDIEGKIEYVNPKFLEVTGYALEEVLGQNPRFLKSGKTPDEAYRELWAAVSRGGEWHGEMCNKKKNGELYWEQSSISAIADGKGRITHYIGVKEDITERRRIAEELHRSHDELEQFAYVASHDLRQPLRMVTSYLQLIERKLGASLQGDVREFMDFAMDGAKRMDKLIISLLEYSRTGRSAEPFAAVDLNLAVKECLQNLELAIADAGASVTVAGELPTITGHWMELVRLLQNLIGNAIKYRSPERPPEISIACRREANEWILAVKDNGMGMDPKDHKRAFAIFQRLVPSQDYEGTGIGLAVCKKIVEHHKGRIWIESVLGEGCCFYVALPAAI